MARRKIFQKPSNATSPSIVIGPSIIGTPTLGVATAFNQVTANGTAPLIGTQQWTRDNVAIAGATGLTYTPVALDVGTTLRVVVTISNAYGSTSVNGTSPGKVVAGVVGVPPTVTSPATIIGSAVMGTAVSYTPATVTGTSPFTRTRVWTRNGVTIAGATATTYTPVSADVGTTLRVVETIANGFLPNATSVSAGVVVTGIVLTKISEPVINGTPIVGIATSFTPTGVSGTLAVTRTYQWKLDGSNISGATSATYTPVAGDVGHTLTIVETVDNGFNSVVGTSAGKVVVAAQVITTGGVAITVSADPLVVPSIVPPGTTFFAASCSRASVLAAIALAAPGDTVRVPPGTCTWAGDISISGIRLIGAGQSATTGTIITAGMVTLTKHATQYTRLSGIRFTGGDQHISAGGAASAKPYVIDNNFLEMDVASKALQLLANGGLMHHNTLTASNATSADVFNIQTPEDWSLAHSLGNLDVTGERNIYLEDNTFSGVLETCPDGDIGARMVIRHNTYTDSSIVFHGGAPNDSSPGGGNRQFEVYSNTFNRVSNVFAINKWVWVRGGTGVIANNVIARADSPDGFSYPNKIELRLSLACPNAYPMQYQVGQVTPTPTNPPTRPLLIFGNTGPGTSDSNYISVNSSDTAGGSCANPTNYIQPGRDYMLSNTWGWVPYAYPHPLQAALP